MRQNNELGQRQRAQTAVSDETVKQMEAPRREGAPEKHGGGDLDQAQSTGQ